MIPPKSLASSFFQRGRIDDRSGAGGDQQIVNTSMSRPKSTARQKVESPAAFAVKNLTTFLPFVI